MICSGHKKNHNDICTFCIDIPSKSCRGPLCVYIPLSVSANLDLSQRWDCFLQMNGISSISCKTASTPAGLTQVNAEQPKFLTSLSLALRDVKMRMAHFKLTSLDTDSTIGILFDPLSSFLLKRLKEIKLLDWLLSKLKLRDSFSRSFVPLCF